MTVTHDCRTIFDTVFIFWIHYSSKKAHFTLMSSLRVEPQFYAKIKDKYDDDKPVRISIKSMIWSRVLFYSIKPSFLYWKGVPFYLSILIFFYFNGKIKVFERYSATLNQTNIGNVSKNITEKEMEISLKIIFKFLTK